MRSNAVARLPTGDDYEALIFDWDGTLVDSRHNYHRALETALCDCGVALDPGWYRQRQGVASRDLLAEWEQTVAPLPEPIDTIIDRYRRNLVTGAPTLKIIEETADVARQAHRRSQLLAIGSNSTAALLDAGMRATGLASLFRETVCWSDVPRGRGKPAPDIFLLAAQRLGVSPDRCLVFEDGDEGVAAAVAAGMDVYNVRSHALRSPPQPT